MTPEINLSEVKEQVQAAILSLNAACDGAIRKDGQGFNAFDAQFGRNLAIYIERNGALTEGQFKAAWKMVAGYPRQVGKLAPFKASYFEQSKPSKNGTPRYIELVGGLIHIVFGKRPSAEDRAALDTLSYRRWNPDIKDMPWQTNASEAVKVNQLFGEREGWRYSPSFLDLVTKLAADPHHKLPLNTASAPKITVEDNMIRFYFGGPPQKKHRQLLDRFDRKWQPDLPGKPWESPLSVIEQVGALFSDCNLTPDFNIELQKFQHRKIASRAATSDFEIPGMRTSLLPFQRAGVENIEMSNGRHLLTDDMGLGKTPQALAYLQLHPEMRPAIIVVPASLKINWSREIRKFMTNPERVAILAGQTPDKALLADSTILIINYEILTHWYEALAELEPQVLIVDEAHKIKNPKAQRTQAIVGHYKSKMKGLAHIAKAYIPMTGTPIRNRPMELFTHLNAIDPKAWGNWYQFATKYNGFIRGQGLGRAQNLGELHERIKPYVTRRTKAEVMQELPSKLRTTIVLEFDESERKLHDDFLAEAQMLSGANHLAMIEKAKQAAARGKMDACIKWITEFLESGEKLIVFATHREITSILWEQFKERAVMVRGGISQKKRQEAVDQFQNNPLINLFIGNIQAAGVGLTLTAASNVAIIEFPWTPDDVEQAIDRCHRIGQTQSVTAWHLVAENTIEEHIVALLQEKAEVIHQVMDGTHVDKQFSILSELSKILRSNTEQIKDTIKEL